MGEDEKLKVLLQDQQNAVSSARYYETKRGLNGGNTDKKDDLPDHPEHSDGGGVLRRKLQGPPPPPPPDKRRVMPGDTLCPAMPDLKNGQLTYSNPDRLYPCRCVR